MEFTVDESLESTQIAEGHVHISSLGSQDRTRPELKIVRLLTLADPGLYKYQERQFDGASFSDIDDALGFAYDLNFQNDLVTGSPTSHRNYHHYPMFKRYGIGWLISGFGHLEDASNAWLGTTEESDAPKEDYLDDLSGLNGGFTETKLVRMAYIHDGLQTLWGFYRDYTYDASGHLRKISKEIRVEIDEPIACDILE